MPGRKSALLVLIPGVIVIATAVRDFGNDTSWFTWWLLLGGVALVLYGIFGGGLAHHSDRRRTGGDVG